MDIYSLKMIIQYNTLPFQKVSSNCSNKFPSASNDGDEYMTSLTQYNNLKEAAEVPDPLSADDSQFILKPVAIEEDCSAHSKETPELEEDEFEVCEDSPVDFEPKKPIAEEICTECAEIFKDEECAEIFEDEECAEIFEDEECATCETKQEFVFIKRRPSDTKAEEKFFVRSLHSGSRRSLSCEVKVFYVIMMLVMIVSGTTAIEDDTLIKLNGRINFECMHPGAIDYHWLLNSSNLRELDVHSEITNPFGIGILALGFIPYSVNNTVLQCIAILTENRTETVFQTTLYVQGVLSPVSNLRYFLKEDNLGITWDAPFSLNFIEENKRYSVDVFNHVTKRILILRSNIYSTNISINVSDNAIYCGAYSVRVIAVNIAGSSTPSTVRLWNRELRFSSVSVAPSSIGNQKTVFITMMQDLCFLYTPLEVTHSGISTKVIGMTNQSNVLQFMLAEDQRYVITLTFNNLNLRITSSEIHISTFDVMNTTVGAVEEDGVNLTSVFLPKSNAGGVLYAFMFIGFNENIDFARSRFFPVYRRDAILGVKKNILNGTYRLLSFDIESNKVLRNKTSPAYINNNVEISSSGYKEIIPYTGKCVIEECGENMVNISCECEGSGYYQALLQENDGTLDSVDVIQARRSSCLHSVTFQVNNGRYCITVFYEKGGDLIFGSSVYYAKEFDIVGSTTSHDGISVGDTEASTSTSKITTGVAVAILVLFGFALVIFLLISLTTWNCAYRKKKRKNRSITLEAAGVEEPKLCEPTNGSSLNTEHTPMERFSEVSGENGVPHHEDSDDQVNDCSGEDNSAASTSTQLTSISSGEDTPVDSKDNELQHTQEMDGISRISGGTVTRVDDYPQSPHIEDHIMNGSFQSGFQNIFYMELSTDLMCIDSCSLEEPMDSFVPKESMSSIDLISNSSKPYEEAEEVDESPSTLLDLLTAAKWDSLGICLGFLPGETDVIKANVKGANVRVEFYFHNVLAAWLSEAHASITRDVLDDLLIFPPAPPELKQKHDVMREPDRKESDECHLFQLLF